MPILQPLESMERISRQALADDLDTVLERISRENIGLVITEKGKDDLVLCPSSWFNLDDVDDFSCVINSALHYAMRKMRRVRRSFSTPVATTSCSMKRRFRWLSPIWSGN